MKSPKKERLDVLLCERQLAPSRTKAQALIMAGQVRVAGEIVRKVGQQVPLDKPIDLIAGPKYVSRGGEKLEGALEDFSVSPAGLVCIDVGSSTGGFTDCLLQHSAQFVIAVDVGKGQLDASLRSDPRVLSMEETHIKDLTPEQLPKTPELAVVDVSFISLKNVLPSLRKLLAPNITVLAMVKPQFEVGAKFLKKGVVRSEEVRVQAVNSMIQFAKEISFTYLGQTPARLKGPRGNQEVFLHLKTI